MDCGQSLTGCSHKKRHFRAHLSHKGRGKRQDRSARPAELVLYAALKKQNTLNYPRLVNSRALTSIGVFSASGGGREKNRQLPSQRGLRELNRVSCVILPRSPKGKFLEVPHQPRRSHSGSCEVPLICTSRRHTLSTAIRAPAAASTSNSAATAAPGGRRAPGLLPSATSDWM